MYLHPYLQLRQKRYVFHSCSIGIVCMHEVEALDFAGSGPPASFDSNVLQQRLQNLTLNWVWSRIFKTSSIFESPIWVEEVSYRANTSLGDYWVDPMFQRTEPPNASTARPRPKCTSYSVSEQSSFDVIRLNISQLAQFSYLESKRVRAEFRGWSKR